MQRSSLRSSLAFGLALSLVSALLSAQQRTAAPAGPHRPFPHGGAGPAPIPMQPALPAGTLDLRVEPAQGASIGGFLTTVSTNFVNVPRASASFVAEKDSTPLVAVFSAEAFTSSSTGRMFVRALVDGVVAAPTSVLFTEGTFQGARSFAFTAVVARGIHTVEIQWLVDAGVTGSLRAEALELRHGVNVAHRTPPSGGDPVTTVQSFLPVPSCDVSFELPVAGEAVVAFSAETHVSGVNRRLFVRALVDGVVCSPGDVVFAGRASRQVHQMRFRTPALAAGAHVARIEWLVDAGGVATLGDRTAWVTYEAPRPGSEERIVVPPSGPAVTTSSGAWTQVPGLSALLRLPANAEIAASFSGEVQAGSSGILEMRLVTPGPTQSDPVVLAQGGFVFETQSFTFDRKHVFLSSSTTLAGIWLEWRSLGGLVSMGDRALHLTIESGAIPDLAEAPAIGRGTEEDPEGRPVEAAIGQRKVLTLIHGIVRAAPNHVIPSVAQVTDALFGVPSVADYFDKVSGGRFGLTNAGVLTYDALESEDHYWNHAIYDCGMPLADGYTGGFAHGWAEVIQSANADVNFADYDTNGDGILQPESELAILIVKPQGEVRGFTRALNVHCTGAPVVVDGVIIPSISEWYVSAPAAFWQTAAHELAHLVLGLTDLYHDGFDFDTEVGALSLMGNQGTSTTHPDPLHKLALGWATPVVAPVDGEYELFDVKTSEEVLVLPRDRDGDGMECFLLEGRRSEFNHPNYDSGTGTNGLIVWHIVETPAQNATPPSCMSALEWASVGSNGQRALRVLRPGIDFASGGSSDWGSGSYDLLDHGLSCGGIVFARNALLWADGSESDWNLIGFGAIGPASYFRVERD